MQAGRTIRGVLSAVLVLSAIGAADAHAREVVHGFDTLTAGARVTDRLPGVRFLDDVEVFRPRTTPFSAPHGLRRKDACIAGGADVCVDGAWRLRFELTDPARTVAIRVGDDGGCFEICTQVRMVGFTRSGEVVADSLAGGPRPDAAPPGTTSARLARRIAIAAADYSITHVTVFFGREAGVPGAVTGVPGRVQLDDLRFSVRDDGGVPEPEPPPPPPPPPAVTITEPGESGFVPDGRLFFVRGRAIVHGAPTQLCAVVDAAPEEFPPGCDAAPTLPEDGRFVLRLRDVAPGAHRIAVWLRDALGRTATASLRVTVGAEIKVDLLDVSQAIQRFDLHPEDGLAAPLPPAVPYAHRAFRYRGVPLAEGKVTVVRLHAAIDAPRTLAGSDRPLARLHGFRRTTDGLVALAGSPLGAWRVPPAIGSERLAARRARASAAYEFRLPVGWASGRVVLIGEVSPPGVSGSLSECAACRADNAYRLDLRFTPVRSYTVSTARLLDNDPARVPIALPARASMAFAPFQTIVPVRLDVHPYAVNIDVSDIDPRDADAEDRVLDRVQEAKDNVGSLVGITIALHDGRYGGGLSHRTWASGLFDLIDDPAAHANWRRPLTSAGHEFLHQLGLRHAGRDCEGVERAEAWPPDDKGAINGWGLDPSPPRTGEHHRIFGVTDPGRFEPAWPVARYDVMSYCTNGADSRAWISVRNWTRLLG